jgi:peptidoglycan/xylan/chitin deacetylase (PgdA/CDA1 family)
MASVRTIKICLDALYFGGLALVSRSLLRGCGTIFCLHHVVPNQIERNSFAPNAHLETTPEFLAKIIELVRERGYETLSMGDAVERLKSPNVSAKPFAVFTLDDGYKDNRIFAQPVFNRYQCPFTIFVAPGIVEGTTEVWWRALEKIIATNTEVHARISGLDFCVASATIAEKNKAWNKLYPILRDAAEHEQRNSIREMAHRYAVDLKLLSQNLAMSWDELRTIAADPLCTIGAHTLNHYLVAKLEVEEARLEMEQSAKIISRKLGMPIRFFAYPYGDEAAAGPRDFAIASDAGFLASVTTRKGVVTRPHVQHLQALPRTMISSRYNKIRYIDTLLSGAPTFLLNGFKNLNVS